MALRPLDGAAASGAFCVLAIPLHFRCILIDKARVPWYDEDGFGK